MTANSSEPSADAWELPNTFDFRGQVVRHGAIGEGSPLVLLHGAGFRSVAEASHLVQEDAPEAIVAVVLEFLQEARAPSREENQRRYGLR